MSPLTELFRAMGRDRTGAGTPLLKVGGRLVAFVPVRSNERLEDCLPDTKDTDGAGLVMEGGGGAGSKRFPVEVSRFVRLRVLEWIKIHGLVSIGC